MTRPIKTLALALSTVGVLSIAGLAFAAQAQTTDAPAPPAASPAPAAAPAAEAPAAPAAGSATLTLTFAGIKTPSGNLMIGLYDSEAGYEGSKPLKGLIVIVSGDTAATTVKDLAPGTYAIKMYHDIDSNGKMGTNPFGIPTEPYAFSNDAKGSMGPAKWAAASFTVAPGDNAQTINID